MNLENRLKNLRQKLTEKELDAIFISQPENRSYISGFDGSSGYLLVTQKEQILATDFRYIEQAKIQASSYDIFQISGEVGDWFPKLAAESSSRRLGFEAGHFTFALYRNLTKTLGEGQSQLQLVPVDGLVESLRAVKEPEEIELITKAAEISDNAFEYIKDMIHTGMSEREAAWELEKFMREKGSQTIPFDIIVASGPNSALPHAKPSPRAIQSGEPILIDIGAKVGGYSSDLSRTICLGLPDDIFRKVYDAVLGAQLAAKAIIKEGMTGKEADSVARTVIEQTGHGEAFGHALGHGVGLAPHESPYLSPKSLEKLVDSMVFTIEPGIYLSGWGGVRIEDLVIMKEGQVRAISKAAK